MLKKMLLSILTVSALAVGMSSGQKTVLSGRPGAMQTSAVQVQEEPEETAPEIAIPELVTPEAAESGSVTPEAEITDAVTPGTETPEDAPAGEEPPADIPAAEPAAAPEAVSGDLSRDGHGEEISACPDGAYDAPMAAEVFALVNQYRMENGLSELSYDVRAEETARIRAYEITEVFGHVRPDGTPLSDSPLIAGENLARYYSSAAEAMEAWKSSPEHNANMLDPGFTGLGCAVLNRPDEIGDACYFVQIYTGDV